MQVGHPKDSNFIIYFIFQARNSFLRRVERIIRLQTCKPINIVYERQQQQQ